MLDSRQLEPALTAQEQLLRDAFVAEYLKDFDAYKACIRMGFLVTYAVQWSQNLINDGYVQRKIAFMTAKPAESPEQEAMDRAMVEMTLRQVMKQGSDSARVAAAGKFMILKGWDKPPEDGSGSEDLVDAFRRVAEQLPS